MKAISITFQVFVIAGWLAFSISIGFAVAGVAGILAGEIAGFLAIFLTLAMVIISNYDPSADSRWFIGLTCAIWLVFSVIATGKLLSISMSLGWASFLAVLLGVAWIIALVVKSKTN